MLLAATYLNLSSIDPETATQEFSHHIVPLIAKPMRPNPYIVFTDGSILNTDSKEVFESPAEIFPYKADIVAFTCQYFGWQETILQAREFIIDMQSDKETEEFHIEFNDSSWITLAVASNGIAIMTATPR